MINLLISISSLILAVITYKLNLKYNKVEKHGIMIVLFVILIIIFLLSCGLSGFFMGESIKYFRGIKTLFFN